MQIELDSKSSWFGADFWRSRMRSVVLYCVILGIFLGNLGFLYDYTLKINLLRDDVQHRIESELEDGIEAYIKLINDGAQHALFFADIPLVQRALSDPSGGAMEQLSLIIERFADAYGRYLQVRILDDQGKEVVRFDRYQVEEVPLRVSDLQDKSDTEYFREAKMLAPGGAYISAISPNFENGVIQVPHVPTYRTVVPIDVGGDNGARVGYFVLNTRVGDFLQSIASEFFPQLERYSVAFRVVSNQSQKADLWTLQDGIWSHEVGGDLPRSLSDHKVFFVMADPRASFGRFAQSSTTYLSQSYDRAGSLAFQTNLSSSLSVAVLVDGADWNAFVSRTIHKHALSRYFTILSRSFLGSLVLAFVTLAYLERVARKKHRREKLQKKLDTDHLTGLLSRAGFETKSSEIRDRASSALCVLDIDHFKQINDTYGHATGDKVLRELAEVLDQELRDTDILARWGGEEFVVLLPNVSAHVAHRVAERYRKSVEDFIFVGSNNEVLRVTISIGVSMCLQHDFETTFQTADAALYEAKRLGRNRVVFSSVDHSTEHMLEIGSVIPNVLCRSDCGNFKLHEYIGDKWLVLLSHPKDFTPVCSTELATVSQMAEEWEQRNTKILALSVDPVGEHGRWKTDLAKLSSCEVFFPIVADDDLKLSKRFDMLPEDAYLPNGWMAEDTKTVRGVFIVSPDKRLQASLMYPMSIGRNFTDIIRILDSLQGDAKARTIGQ